MLPWDQAWEKLYDVLGIKDFIYFVSSSSIQDALLPVKIVFILFTLFFLGAVIYLYSNSTYLRYQFFQDTVEFFSWQPYGLHEVNKRWKKIEKMIEGKTDSQYKLAILEADDFLYQVLEERGYKGETFEEMLKNVNERILPDSEKILMAHKIRDAIVYDQNYSLDGEKAKEMLADYEKAIKNITIA